jgi:spoIIIJ-associated protein
MILKGTNPTVGDEEQKMDEIEPIAEKSSEKAEGTLITKLEEEGDIAADYLEGLLDITDLDGDIDIDVENDRASLAIVGGKLSHLVGQNGEVLDALQELTRLAVQTATGDRAGRKSELRQLATERAVEVTSSQSSMKLAPMNAFERKIIHDTIQTLGLRSESEGEDPNRCVVIFPA